MSDRAIICERARVWAALQPDGELSSFEERQLAAHLGWCAECSAFAAGVESSTRAIRSAPAEPLAHPIAVPGGHRRLAPRRAVYSAGVAAAAAAMALSIGSAVSVPNEQTAAPSVPVIVVNGVDDRKDVRDLRQMRRLQLVTNIAPPAVGLPHHFGAEGI